MEPGSRFTQHMSKFFLPKSTLGKCRWTNKERTCKCVPLFLSKLFGTISLPLPSQNQRSPTVCPSNGFAISLSWSWFSVVTKKLWHTGKPVQIKIWFGSFSERRNRGDEEEKTVQTEIGHFFFSSGKMKKCYYSQFEVFSLVQTVLFWYVINFENIFLTVLWNKHSGFELF